MRVRRPRSNRRTDRQGAGVLLARLPGGAIGGVVVVAVLLAAAVALVAAARSGPAHAATGPEPWWSGPAVGDLQLTDEDDGFVDYGSCEASGDSGCASPLSIQTTTGCATNPVAIDDQPISVDRLAGALVARYREGATRVSTANRAITVFAFERSVTDAAIRQLRPRSADAPPALLPAPRWPRPVFAELRRVVDQRRRTPAIRDVARRIGISQSAARLRLRLAHLLPAGTLDGVPPPRLSWAEISRRRTAVRLALDGLDGVDGLDRRTLARWRRSVRGLVGGPC
jgi:hypothetical protein